MNADILVPYTQVNYYVLDMFAHGNSHVFILYIPGSGTPLACV